MKWKWLGRLGITRNSEKKAFEAFEAFSEKKRFFTHHPHHNKKLIFLCVTQSNT